MSFAKLKKSRSNSMDALVKAAEAASGSNNKNRDEGLWKPSRDKAGNGYAVIRFLPPADGDDLPWAKYWDHGFQGPSGLWYIENSLTSIGQDDPVSEMNSELWASGLDEDKATARERKRRLHYVSNIYVVSDPSTPANEGKVFHYKFGKKIFDKIMDVMQPQFEDEKPVNPYDFWEGAEFKVKIRKVEGWVNYDKSEFGAISQFMGGDEAKLEEVYNECKPLSAFADPKNYKTYDELKARLLKVLGETRPTKTAEEIDLSKSAEAPKQKSMPAKSERNYQDDDSPVPAEPAVEEEDDALSYFDKLANG
jgi:hypothetical protein